MTTPAFLIVSQFAVNSQSIRQKNWRFIFYKIDSNNNTFIDKNNIIKMSNTIDMSKITDDELIEEFKKRFMVLQFYDKDCIEMLVNEGEEMSQEEYEQFKKYCVDNNLYYRVDDIILEAWDEMTILYKIETK
jgi:hypothetical protein